MTFERLTEALHRRFPGSDDRVVSACALEILSEHSFADAFDAASRRNVRPDRDVIDLRRAQSSVERAMALLDGLGLHGRDRVHALLGARIAGHGVDFLTGRLEVISKVLDEAAARINPEGRPYFDTDGQADFVGPGRASPDVPAAVVRVCAHAYEKLTGERATRRTEVLTGESYGPFFEMVKEVFEVLAISASVENSLRQGLSSME